MTDDDHEEDHEIHGISIPLPGLRNLLAQTSAQHEREHMEGMSTQQQIYGLLDSLTVEQLLALRVMLGIDSKSAMCNYFEGQVVSILRLVHGVDPATGLTPQEALERVEQGMD